MRVIIEARIEDARTGSAAAQAMVVAVLEREDQSVADLGLTLAEGRALLAQVQSMLVSHQAASWVAGHATCCRCGAMLAHKDCRAIVMRTVFGAVELASWRVGESKVMVRVAARPKRREPRRTASSLCKALPRRVTPELE